MLIEGSLLSLRESSVRRYENLPVSWSFLGDLDVQLPEGYHEIAHAKHHLNYFRRRMRILEYKGAMNVSYGDPLVPLKVGVVARLCSVSALEGFDFMEASLRLRQDTIDVLIERSVRSDHWKQSVIDFEKAFYDASGVTEEVRRLYEVDGNAYDAAHERVTELIQEYRAFEEIAQRYTVRVLTEVFGLSISGQA